MALRLSMLGELEVERDGAVVALPRSKKTRAMLAYLVLTGREHRRERLCTLLWDVADDPRAALRWVLSRLRKVVDEPDTPRIRASRTAVSFDVEGVDVDVLAVRSRIADGIDTLDTPALAALAEQLEPELLEGLELEDFDTFQAWLLAEREALAAARFEALEALVERHPTDPEARLPWLRQLVDARPLDEAVRAELVRTLVALDRYREANQQVQAGKRALEEVGRRSSGALRAALRSVPESSVPSDPSVPHASPTSDRSTSQATSEPLPGPPDPRTAFVGRDALRSQLTEALTAGALVVLLGPSGVGKTRLAAEVAAGWDRCVWCDLVSARTADEFVEQMARVFRVSVPTGPDRMASIGRAWSQHRGLLVLDNMEQIDGHEPLVDALWRSGPRDPLLVTTQRRPGLVGERVVEVPPLDADEARALFVQRATAVNGSFAPDDVALQALVERLDRLPLALELAAARTRLMGASQLLAALDRPRSPTGRDRHASIEDAVAWSWGLLSEPAQAALVQLSVFADAFDLDAALAVLDVALDPIEVIQTLRDQCLVQAQSRDDRVMLRLTHAVCTWAQGHRAQHDPEGAACQRHADWLVELVKQRDPFYAPDQLRELRRVRPELMRAMTWAVERGEADHAFWLLVGVADLAWAWGPPSVVPELAVQVLPVLEGNEAAQARVRVLRATFSRRLGDLVGAQEDLDWAEAAAERAQSREGLRDVCAERYRWAFEQGDFEAAADWARRAHEAWGADRAAVSLAWRAKWLMCDESPEATAAWRDAIAAAHRLGDILAECNAHLSLADLWRRSGEPMAARPHLEAAIRLAKMGQDGSASARASHGLMLLLQDVDPRAAFAASVDAVDGWERLDSPRRMASACLGACHSAPGAATAVAYGERALDVGLTRADDGLIAQARLALGRRAEPRAAIGHLRAAREIVCQHPFGSVAVAVYVALAQRALVDGDLEYAERLLADVADVSVELPLLVLERDITTAWAARLRGADTVERGALERRSEALAVHPDSRLGRLWREAFSAEA